MTTSDDSSTSCQCRATTTGFKPFLGKARELVPRVQYVLSAEDS